MYIFFDIGFLIGAFVSFIHEEFDLGGGLLAGLFLYPWVWEPFLMIIFRIKNCCTSRPYKDDFNDLSKRGCNLVYHPKYNMKLCGIEKQHSFDSCKYERVIGYLKNDHQYKLTPTKEENQELGQSEKLFLKSHSNLYCLIIILTSRIHRKILLPFICRLCLHLLKCIPSAFNSA
jgi:hypothetical protein